MENQATQVALGFHPRLEIGAPDADDAHVRQRISGIGVPALGGHADQVSRLAEARNLPAAVRHQLVKANRTTRSEEHTSELQSLMSLSYDVFCLKKKKNNSTQSTNQHTPH